MTVLAVMKGVIGPGVLYMPYGFVEGGYAFAIPMLALSWLMFAWGTVRLLAVWNVHKVSYATLMSLALGPSFAAAARVVICLNQVALCLSYFIFISQNLRGITGMPATKLCVLQLLFHIPMAWIRDIRNLRHTNMFANFLIANSLTVMIAFAADGVHSHACDAQAFNQLTFYEFIGTAAFIWEGMSVLAVPLQAAMKPKYQSLFPTIFVCTTGVITLGYGCFAMLNVCAYGAKTQVVLTNNIAHGNSKTLVRVAYSMAVALTFPLQLAPAASMLSEFIDSMMRRCVEPKPINYLCGQTWSELVDRGARSICVCILCTLAISLIDSLSKLIGLVGCMLGVPLAFIFPSLISCFLDKNLSDLVKSVNYMVIGLGSITCVATSVITIINWDHLNDAEE